MLGIYNTFECSPIKMKRRIGLMKMKKHIEFLTSALKILTLSFLKIL